jgi:hypothetical protein
MNVSTHIMELARQVRSSTIELLEAARPEWLLRAPTGTSNHILWHAGHAIWLQDALCLKPLTGQSHLQPGWAETFGMNCRSPAETYGWPSEQSLAFQLRLQLEEILMACIRHADRLEAAEPEPARGWGLVPGILHGLHDEARHQGEMYLLLKLCRAGSAG